jgi:hypothetical protein
MEQCRRAMKQCKPVLLGRALAATMVASAAPAVAQRTTRTPGHPTATTLLGIRSHARLRSAQRGSDALAIRPLTPEACRFLRRLETKPKMSSGLKQTQRRREALNGPGRLE